MRLLCIIIGVAQEIEGRVEFSAKSSYRLHRRTEEGVYSATRMNPYHVITAALLVTLGVILQLSSTDACSCMPEHAQTAYCDAEYVIVAQVLRKSKRSYNGNNVYKIAIKKEYKMSPHAQKLLRPGKLITPPESSLCGVQLEVNQLYAIAAKDVHISLCGFVRKYGDLTIVEKRGLAGIYRKGCPCEIKPCFSESCNVTIGACNWNLWGDSCESSFGSCIPTRGHLIDGVPAKCHWRRSPLYQKCKTTRE